MPSINYYIKSKKNPANIYIRLSHSTTLDKFVPTGIYINPTQWDKKKQRLKSTSNIHNNKINTKLFELKEYMYNKFTQDYMSGVIIDKLWINRKVKQFFNRPKEEEKLKNQDYLIYLTNFADWWINNHAKNWRINSKGFMTEASKRHLKAFLKLLKKHENENKIKISFKTVTSESIYKFINWAENNDYQYQTLKRHVSRFKFFCARAEEHNIKVNKDYKTRIYIQKPDPIKEPYLNLDELNEIYKYNFLYSERLDNARDNLIIGCWTGLRVSDLFKNLNETSLDGKYIDVKNNKTNRWVSIPMHWMVKEILNKRNGKLPKKISDQRFNKYIKEICFIAGIDNIIKGKLTISEEIKDAPLTLDKNGKVKKQYKKRKVVGMYPKHKLITSHICRRSFATNLYAAKVDNKLIMAAAGWSKEEQMLDYVKMSSRDSAIQLEKHFQNI